MIKKTEDLFIKYRSQIDTESIIKNVNLKADEAEFRKTVEIFYSKLNYLEGRSSKYDHELNMLRTNIKRLVPYVKVVFERISEESSDAGNKCISIGSIKSVKSKNKIYDKRFSSEKSEQIDKIKNIQKIKKNYIKINDFEAMNEDLESSYNLTDFNKSLKRKGAHSLSFQESPLDTDFISNIPPSAIKPTLNDRVQTAKMKLRLPPTFQAINIVHKEQVIRQMKTAEDYN